MALGRAEDRAEERTLLDAALAVLEKRTPPHPRLQEDSGGQREVDGDRGAVCWCH